jgi:hypothetical protein
MILKRQKAGKIKNCREVEEWLKIFFMFRDIDPIAIM